MPTTLNLILFGATGLIIFAVVVRQKIANAEPRWLKVFTAIPFCAMGSLFVSTYVAQWTGAARPSPETGQTAAWLYQGHTYYISDALLRFINGAETVGITITFAFMLVVAIYHFIVKRPNGEHG
jgi:hypothetical protein